MALQRSVFVKQGSNEDLEESIGGTSWQSN